MSWVSRRGGGGGGRGRPFTVAAVTVAAGLLAVAVAWSAQPHAVQWAMRRAAEAAVAAAEARALDGLPAADFEAPPTPASLGSLAARLEPPLGRLREDGAGGVLQLQLYARDGTVLYSARPERRGRKVLPARVPRLAAALAGAANARLLLLNAADEAELGERYAEAIAVYAPVAREGRVVGAAEVYAEIGPVRWARLGVWAAVVGLVTLALLVYVRARQAEQEDRLERLTREAFFDSLTGLANRALFRFRLQQAFHRAARRGEQLAVMFVDLDRFKQVNDTLGHAAGDQLLAQVAGRLQGAVRPEDTVARLGGDEFTVLLESVPGAAEAAAVAERILRAMRAPFALGGREASVRASVGIALRGPGHRAPDELLRDADAALYRAKAAGKDRLEFADPAPQPHPDLRRAS